MLPAPAAHEMRMEPHAAFQAVQEWEGYVVEITASEFVARLVDLTAGPSHEEEEAIIPLAQVSDHDAARLRLGSIFRWVIGYETSAVESEKWVSRIVFRDLPKVTKTDLREGKAWARRVLESFDT
jgi:hypothetical protein